MPGVSGSICSGQHSGMIDRNCSSIRSMRVTMLIPSSSKNTCRPTFSRRTTPARCRTARWRETTDWSCGTCAASVWTSDRPRGGEQLHDLDAHRFAQGAEQLRVDDGAQLAGGALTMAAGGWVGGGRRIHLKRAYMHMGANVKRSPRRRPGARPRAGESGAGSCPVAPPPGNATTRPQALRAAFAFASLRMAIA